jgi:hypothetical protein
LVERATASLRAEYENSSKKDWFDRIVGPSAGTAYAELAMELSTKEDAVGSPEDAAEEMAHLVELLRE